MSDFDKFIQYVILALLAFVVWQDHKSKDSQPPENLNHSGSMADKQLANHLRKQRRGN